MAAGGDGAAAGSSGGAAGSYCCCCGGCEAVVSKHLEDLRADLRGVVEGAIGSQVAVLSQRVCEELQRGQRGNSPRKSRCSVGGCGRGNSPRKSRCSVGGGGRGERVDPGRASPSLSQGSSPTKATSDGAKLNGKVRGELWKLFVEGEDNVGSPSAAGAKPSLCRAGSRESLPASRWPNLLEPGASPCKAQQSRTLPQRLSTLELDGALAAACDTPTAWAASPEARSLPTETREPPSPGHLNSVVPAAAAAADRTEAGSPIAAWPPSPAGAKTAAAAPPRGNGLARWRQGSSGGVKRPQTRFLAVAGMPELICSGASWKSRVECCVKHPGFDWFFCFFIVLNSLTFGAQTDYMARNQPCQMPMVFQLIEAIFCCAFTIELSLRVSVHKCAFFRGKGWLWNIFDIQMVIVQQIEVVLSFMTPDTSAVLPQNLAVARMLRILRLVRVARLVRFLRLVRELRLLVSSIISSMKSLGWTVLLLLVMIYCVSLILTQLVSDHRAENGENIETENLLYYYGSLGRSMLSLFQAVTGGVDWNDCVAPLIVEISPLMAILFSIYIAFCTLAMMNVVTGIFVENVLISARADKDHYLVSNARDIFKTLDGGVNGEMTLEDFLDKVDTPEMIEFFKGIDVDPSEAPSLFALIDQDGSGAIDAEEFLRACIRLRGPAMALDTAGLVQQVRQLTNSLQDQRQLVEEALATKQSEAPMDE